MNTQHPDLLEVLLSLLGAMESPRTAKAWAAYVAAWEAVAQAKENRQREAFNASLPSPFHEDVAP
jgi:hypothetical protein